jgi:hypothetical protein
MGTQTPVLLEENVERRTISLVCGPPSCCVVETTANEKRRWRASSYGSPSTKTTLRNIFVHSKNVFKYERLTGAPYGDDGDEDESAKVIPFSQQEQEHKTTNRKAETTFTKQWYIGSKQAHPDDGQDSVVH